MTESRLGDPTAVRYLFKRALEANPRSRYAHLAWAMWEREQVGCSGLGTTAVLCTALALYCTALQHSTRGA